MSAQDFVHSAVVNNPHIAHSEHLLHNLKEIGMGGAWDRTGNNGQIVQSYMDALNDAVADENRDPVVTVIRGMEITQAGIPTCMLYLYLGNGQSRLASFVNVTASNNGVATVITTHTATIDDNNIAITFTPETTQYNYTDFKVICTRGGLQVVIPFDPFKASTDLYRYESVGQDMKTRVVEPIIRTQDGTSVTFSGGIVETYVKISGRVPTNIVGTNLNTPVSTDYRVSIEDETTMIVNLLYRTDCSQLSDADKATLYAKPRHFMELSEGELIPIEGLFTNG